MAGIVDRLREEEKEAEKLLYSDELEPEEREEEEVELEEGSNAQDETEIRDSEEEDTEEETEKTGRTSWKKRFTNYKATTDLTLHSLRKSNSQLKADNEALRDKILDMEGKIHELSIQKEQTSDPFDGVVSDEDLEVLGPEAVAVLKKITKAGMEKTKAASEAEAKRLKQTIKEFQELRAKEAKIAAEAEKNESLAEFRGRLVDRIRNFDKLDQDKRFAEYLKGMDEASGLPRANLFRTAIDGRDVLGVARFYNEFAGTLPKSKEERLEEEITPVGKGTSPSIDVTKDSRKKTYTIQQYEDFMHNVTLGKYKGREAEAKKIERMFDTAFLEGRVTY